MRVGLILAAATMLCALPADAATWLRYEISGTGLEEVAITGNLPVLTFVSSRRDFRANFSVEVDPVAATYDPVGRVAYVSTGLEFSVASIFPGAGQAFFVNGSQANTLTLLSPGMATPFLDIRSTVQYADGDAMIGLPRALASGVASGTLYYNSTTRSAIRTVNGTVDRFAIIGVTDGYEPFTLTTVPEPASWAMMILGAGAIGAAARRRRNSAAYA